MLGNGEDLAKVKELVDLEEHCLTRTKNCFIRKLFLSSTMNYTSVLNCQAANVKLPQTLDPASRAFEIGPYINIFAHFLDGQCKAINFYQNLF